MFNEAIDDKTRNRSANLTVFPILACLSTFLCFLPAQADPIPIADLRRSEPVSFENDILPIFRRNCLACHSASEEQGGLVLESPQAILAGGENGPAAVSNRGVESLLLVLASHKDEPVMPPSGNDVAAKNLTPEELGLLKLWIDQGAKGNAGIDSISPKQWRPLPAGVHPANAVAISADGQLVAASRANQIFLYHTASGQLVTQLSDPNLDLNQTVDSNHTTGVAHRDFVQSLALNDAGDLLASGGFREVKLWRRPSDVQQATLQLDSKPSATAVNRNKQMVAIAGEDLAIRIYAKTAANPNTNAAQQNDHSHIDDSKNLKLLFDLKGHTDRITDVVFLPDNNTIVSGSLDKSIRFWNLETQEVISTVQTPTSVTAIALVNSEVINAENPKPKKLLVAGDDTKMIRVWELPDPMPNSISESSREFTVHSKAISDLAAIDSLPNQVYSASLDGTARLVDLTNGRSLRGFSQGSAVNSIAVSPDGQRIAAAGDNGRVRLFRSNGQTIKEMRGDIRLTATLTRAQQLVRSANSRVNIAKRSVERAEQELPKKTESEKTLAESLADANNAVAEKQKSVDEAHVKKTNAEKAAIEASKRSKDALAEKQAAELASQLAVSTVKDAEEKVRQLQQALASNQDSDQLNQLLANAEKTLEMAKNDAQQKRSAISEPTTKSQKMANAANQAAQKATETQKPFNDLSAELRTLKANQNLLSQQHALAAKELKDAHSLLPKLKATLQRAEKAKTDAEQALESAKQTLANADQPIRDVCFSKDGKTIATCGDFGRIHTWDGLSGEAIAAFVGHEQSIGSVEFLDEQSLLSCSVDRSARVWTLSPSWTLEQTIGNKDKPNLIVHRVTALDFNAQSTQLAVASGVPSRSGELQVLDLNEKKRLMHLPEAHSDVIYGVSFSPDGKTIASVGADKYLRTFDLSGGKQIRRFEGHTNYVLGVGWKSDGETIASSSADNTIKIWDAQTGDQRRTITQQFTKHVTSVQFVGDTDNVISSGGDRRVRIHNSINGGISRNFNPGEAWMHSVAITPDGRTIVSGDAQGTVTIYNGGNGQVLHKLTASQR